MLLNVQSVDRLQHCLDFESNTLIRRYIQQSLDNIHQEE
jgi:hypothetical protein